MAEEEKEAVDEKVAPKPHKHWLLKLFIAIFAGIIALFLLTIFLLPYIIPLISYPEIQIDLAPKLKNLPDELFPDKSVSAKYTISREGDIYNVDANGMLLGWPFTAKAAFDYNLKWLGVDAKGNFSMRLNGSKLAMKGYFRASLPGEWQADIEVEPIRISEEDAYLASLLAKMKDPNIRKMNFDGTFSLTGHVEQTRKMPIPKWSIGGRLKNLDISMLASGDQPMRMENIRTSFGAAGIAEHSDISPMFVHVDLIEYGRKGDKNGYVLTNGFASIRATETAFLVTEAGGEFAGGNIRLYSFFLDAKKLNAGVTMFIDGVDAGEILGHVKSFHGEATGGMRGKIPISLSDGRVSIGECYLHTMPGEKGKFKLYDPAPITDNLQLAGQSKSDCDNVAKALANLDYTLLKLDLKPAGDGRSTLSLVIEGTAANSKVAVPVYLGVNFTGPVDELLDYGQKGLQSYKQLQERMKNNE
ncbi:MAG: YdbH domain-containing protein [Kiritimatiellae bacterium]|nr:YdbH domain-containing protein [Kiritimatiellia bacterium]